MNIDYKNVFLHIISENINLKYWAGIEEEYYNALKKCVNNEAVEQLHWEFSFIKKELVKYLKEQIPENINDIEEDENIKRHICSSVNPNEFYKRKPTDASIGETLFLSVNYTDTEQLYTKYVKNEVIYLHGELKNPDNPIIFGYGLDESGDEYRRLQSRGNQYLENMKSVRYFEMSNYNKLREFIDNDEYQVFVMGHSCGASDSILLKKLFRNDNCLSIKIFYYKNYNNNSDNYGDVRNNIEQYFNDNMEKMRDILVTKEDSEPLS
jgi:hypothetical protein